MGIVLYRDGNTHTVNGVLCELKVIDNKYFTGKAPDGWYLDARDINKEVDDGLQEVKAEKTKEEIKKESSKPTRNMSNKKVREAAEKAGIEDYETARIQTLKSKLAG